VLTAGPRLKHTGQGKLLQGTEEITYRKTSLAAYLRFAGVNRQKTVFWASARRMELKTPFSGDSKGYYELLLSGIPLGN